MLLREREKIRISDMARNLWGGVSHSRCFRNSPVFDHCFVLPKELVFGTALSLSFLRPHDTQNRIAALCILNCTYITPFCRSKVLTIYTSAFLTLTPYPIPQQIANYHVP